MDPTAYAVPQVQETTTVTPTGKATVIPETPPPPSSLPLARMRRAHSHPSPALSLRFPFPQLLLQEPPPHSPRGTGSRSACAFRYPAPPPFALNACALTAHPENRINTSARSRQPLPTANPPWTHCACLVLRVRLSEQSMLSANGLLSPPPPPCALKFPFLGVWAVVKPLSVDPSLPSVSCRLPLLH